MSEMQGESPAEITGQICRHKGHMILEAGAGTGKTYNLTERVIYQLIECKVPLEQMLALTFTDFAAAEMRSRIYEAINRRLQESEHPELEGQGYKTKPDPAGETSDKEKRSEKIRSERDFLNETRRRFSRNYISTFHSFCNRILQYFPDDITEITVKSHPEFSGDERFGPVNSISVDGALELLSDYDEVLCMLEWKKSFYRIYKEHDGLRRQLTRLSISDFETFMQRLGGAGEASLYEMAALTPEAYIRLLKRLSDEWRREAGEMKSALLETFASHPEWFKSWDKIPESMSDLEEHRIGKGFSRKIFNIPEMGEEVYEEVCERGLQLFRWSSELENIEPYIADPASIAGLQDYPGREAEAFDANHEAYWNMRNLADLALRWNTLMRFKRFEAGYFNYDDMIWLTHKLFETNPSVVTQMRSRFKQILLDEFQDTDRRQWEIIRKLAFGNGEGPETESESGDVHCLENKSGDAHILKNVEGNVPGESSGVRRSEGGYPDGDKKRDPDKEILIVGDVKQAIYRFRGGDVAMMGSVHDDIVQHKSDGSHVPLNVLPLTYSFRSNRTVIDFANRLFRNVFSTREKAASYEAHHQPLSVPSDELSNNASADGEIRLLYTDCKQLRKEHDGFSIPAEALADNLMLLEARRIARFLREIYDGKHELYGSLTARMQTGEKAVGVLYKRRAHMYALEQALKEVGLPFTVAKGTQYYQRREVLDAWLLLSFLLDAYDDVSLVGLLRSPMVSFSDSGLLAARVAMDTPGRDYPNFWSAIKDFQVWGGSLLDEKDRFTLETGVPFLQRLREMVPGLRVSELLEQAFFTGGPYSGGSAGDTKVRENIVKLLDVVRSLENSGRGTLYEITEFLANRIREEAGDSEAEQPDPASIQLMTIHGSKGLQFPMVVIPDMYAGQNDGGMQLYAADDDKDSFAFPAVAYKTGNKEGADEAEASFLYQVLKSENQKRGIAETKRLFYVAVTRAETHILMSMARPQKAGAHGTFASFLEPWLLEEVSGDQGDIRIEELTVEELENLATIGMKSFPSSDKKQNRTVKIPDRNHPAFINAVNKVSSEVMTASGLHGGKEEPVTAPALNSHAAVKSMDAASTQIPDPHMSQQTSRWIDLDPADAGTLIHKSLEFGFETLEVEPQNGIEQFWYRELMQLDYPDPDAVIRNNREELIRHCRNATEAMRRIFGVASSKRYETAFEWSTQSAPGASFESGVPGKSGVPDASEVSGATSSFGSPDLSGISGSSDMTDASGEPGTPGSGRTVTLRGSIDIIIRDSDERVHIVDIKTGPVEIKDQNTDALDSTVFRHHAKIYGYDRQIRAYQQAYEAIFGIRIPSTCVWLLFTWPDGGHAVPLSEM